MARRVCYVCVCLRLQGSKRRNGSIERQRGSSGGLHIYCSNIPGAAVEAVASECKQLRSLNLAHCYVQDRQYKIRRR